jgi:hypothetical protein
LFAMLVLMAFVTTLMTGPLLSFTQSTDYTDYTDKERERAD